MRRSFISFVILAIFFSCKNYVQVFEVKSNDCKELRDLWVFENDSVKITYAFWHKKGVLSFTVNNKNDKPLYIDWKKSSFIHNTNKLNYWIDQEVSTSATYYGNYYYPGPILKPGDGLNVGAAVSVETKSKAERITFIPPNSNYYRSQFHLLPVSSHKMDIETKFVEAKRNDNIKKKTKIYSKSYTREDTPTSFRNYLAFSFSEEFDEIFYIDNEFYINKITEMDYRHFRYRVKGKSGDMEEVFPYKNQRSFYLYVPEDQTVAFRQKYGEE